MHTFEDLMRAAATLDAGRAFRARLTPAQWATLANHMTRHDLRAGELLATQGHPERALHLLAQGTLQVHPVPVQPRVELLQPGSAVGEASLFGDGAATASVEALTPCVLWSLPAARFAQIAHQSPPIAVEVLRAAGAVLAWRLRACHDAKDG